MNENGVHVGPIRFWRARTRSLLDAATVAKKANFPHAHADRGLAGNSLIIILIVLISLVPCTLLRVTVAWGNIIQLQQLLQ